MKAVRIRYWYQGTPDNPEPGRWLLSELVKKCNTKKRLAIYQTFYERCEVVDYDEDY